MGCNSFGGAYRVAGDVMTTGPMAMTQMACASALDEPVPSLMDLEGMAHAVLGQPMRMTWKSGRQLTLSNAAGSLELEQAR